ncbi:glycosyltransferase family 2 protein [Sphingomonas piscis]|uniref:Glycosyltransferase family 2 protein n=1 Tax=Sphingomonas piscis TaxID=2714943 RepID=A0A6G7YQU9_9SPHN|nr:glycosyltransferase family 2 protein [Sphingomonas piscis]QIK79112.1 glycosyltransferase family 2 protein [Sphingomonas piscis]
MTLLIMMLVAPLLLMNLTFLAEVIAGLPLAAREGHQRLSQKTTIIVPAHNEARTIKACLDALVRHAGREFDILVVADNCSDDTATIAAEHGVAVISRKDEDQRGKGFALAFAREWLRRSPPDAVIVLDADCRIDRASLTNLAAACLEKKKPCQAIYLFEPCRTKSPMVQISTFAFLLKNLVRQRGLQRLTGGVHLTGTGMSVPWNQFEIADLATSSIVEDLRFGIEMSEAGAPPQLIQSSYVWSGHADVGDTLAQRSRWEGGFLTIARVAGPRMLISGIRRLSIPMTLRGLDLFVPPLALLAAMNAVVLLLTTFITVLDLSSWTPPAILASLGLLMTVAMIVVWWREGRDFIGVAALLSLPVYALWKVPMYAGLLKKGAPQEWLRTPRPDEKDRGA